MTPPRPRLAAAALAVCTALACLCAPTRAQEEPRPATGLSTKTWTPDNGNGTFTNPLFYDEFSDPDLIRVGDWFYLTGTTMHAMPGLPVLRSRDLVNWEFLSYAVDKLDFGPAYRLEDGKSIYGQGIWAPSLRYRNGTFYIFSNVNGRATQVFSATDPRGPWTRREMKRSLHDLSVLFDDDGTAWVVWDHQRMHVARLTDDLTDIVPGTEKILFAQDAGMGEGAHIYKIQGKYYILSANYAGGFRMPAARADKVDGPYEVNQAISRDEDFGMAKGYRLADNKTPTAIVPPDPSARNANSLHQGGIVLTPAGEWWGFSMQDFNSVGRLLSLAPITWKDGWPYFGLPGNLGRNPRTWVKPKTAAPSPVTVPYARSDDFSASILQPVWQWNHVPVDGQWSLTERPGFLRLHALPATSFWQARDTLTQRAIGPRSSPTVTLDASGLADGDVAGLALLNLPYATLGVEKTATGLQLALYDQARDRTVRVPLPALATRVMLRADCDFLTEQARFSWSVDGRAFTPIGEPFTMVFQLKTFQGVRYALFNYNQAGKAGGYADFDSIDVYQPNPHGLMRAIPAGRRIQLAAFPSGRKVASYRVKDMGLGRVALQSGAAWASVDAGGRVGARNGQPGNAESFQWVETPTGELVLMSLVTNRFLRVDPVSHAMRADSPGPVPDGSDGVRFTWTLAGAN
ncbi:glycosyl hydrolase 43 family protein [Massilia sp. TW-1]|uniref:Glycosyl hydrolase 43 family protein n=1 Tax=Telluria antibiotica TaxID=2717319 RepID=A0ABX0P6I4_9BURK|nr:glycoside hydrolase 43 family protein [Telluria antibiotica]NIA52849.1 glycosyl hydrolase 43 family protein [Telluria antibiotica]